MTCDPAWSRGSASSENSYMADVVRKYNPLVVPNVDFLRDPVKVEHPIS